jgi:hypothetical protein
MGPFSDLDVMARESMANKSRVDGAIALCIRRALFLTH